MIVTMIELKIFKKGRKEWLLNNLYHREDGPAIEYSNGDKEWWIDGSFKREELCNET